jgi:alpha-mannosidase
MEKVEGPHLPLAGDVVTVPITPYEILTVQVFYPAHPSGMVAAAQ